MFNQARKKCVCVFTYLCVYVFVCMCVYFNVTRLYGAIVAQWHSVGVWSVYEIAAGFDFHSEVREW